MENKAIRITISDYYRMLLKFDAHIAGNNDTAQARSLLQSHLMKKEEEINRRLTDLAKAQNLTLDELKQQILDSQND